MMKKEDKIALKLNDLIADWFSENEIMNYEDYDNLMLKSEIDDE
jgi:hypothetical protein